MSLNNRVSLLELVNTTSEVAQKVENQLPLFYSIWSPVKMSDSWVKADGTYLSGITYHDQYEYLLKVLNKQIVGTGLSVKTTTDTYDDFDIVVNTTEQTFRLPLLNGEEDRIYNGGVLKDYIGITINTHAFGWTAPFNCEVMIDMEANNSNAYLYAGLGYPYYGTSDYANAAGQQLRKIVRCKKGDILYIDSQNIRSKFEEYVYKLTGTGDLYFFLNCGQSNSNINQDSNYIPKGTTLTIELDGSGDFTSLVDAINYLEGKYSNGEVIIQLGEGTFAYTECITINGSKFNIPSLVINGKGTDKTILSFQANIFNDIEIIEPNANVTISNVKFTSPNLPTSGVLNSDMAICATTLAKVQVDNVEFDNVGTGISVLYDAHVYLKGNITISNATYAIRCYASTVTTNWGITANITNISNTALQIEHGGVFRSGGWTLNTSNVNKVCSVSKNSDSVSGLAYYS